MPTFLFALAAILVGYVIQAIIQPGPTKPSAAAFEDFDFPQMDEGTPQPVIFGDVWSEDWMVGYYGNYRTSEVKNDGSGK